MTPTLTIHFCSPICEEWFHQHPSFGVAQWHNERSRCGYCGDPLPSKVEVAEKVNA